MASLFEDLDVTYQILEFEHHITLLVFLGDEERVLVEATDPVNGFVSDRQEIENRLRKFENPEALRIDGEEIVLTEIRKPEIITLQQLAGLQYFNQAVLLFNSGDYKAALRLTKKSRSLYATSDRIRNFELLLLEM